ncbi:unnamed protein product [Schistosoma mattheei]|uniref:Uncharacterized protein n=1 Tax=Schistosoma mattheei TaxID=31246 RepID=A0A183PB70_9TREM|nr:unnamed protein product [Schistosoma mattheei]
MTSFRANSVEFLTLSFRSDEHLGVVSSECELLVFVEEILLFVSDFITTLLQSSLLSISILGLLSEVPASLGDPNC